VKRRFAPVKRRFALAMARRELRGAVREAVDARAQQLLGADLRLESRAPFEGAAGALLAEIEARAAAPAARVTRFGSMALAPASGRTRLVDVYGVDPTYPLYGAPETDPPGVWAALQGDEPTALVDPGALVQLDLAPGDALALGGVRFRILGTLRRTPGTVGLRTSVAPRIFVARRHVAATGLVQRGSLVEHQAYLRVAPEVQRDWLEARERDLDAAHVDTDTAEEVQSDATRGFAALARTLALVGLAALVLGGIGIASGVRGWLFERVDGVAVLRSLGASFADVLAAYGLAALAIGAAAGLAGAALGTALQAALPALLAGLLPVEVAFRPDPVAIATGVGLGLWTTLLFVAGPLYDLARVPPLRVLRRDLAAEPVSRAGRAAQLAALAASIVAAALWQAPTWRVGLGFAAGLCAALAALAASSFAATALLRRHRLRRAPFWLRQGLANLCRPRNHTLSTTLAIGLGIHLVATLHAVKHNVLAQISLDTRPERPNLVLFDVQRDQLAELRGFLAERGLPVLEQAPLVAARIARVGELAAGDGRGARAEAGADEDPAERERRWALRREYRLTWSAQLRPSEQVVDGAWWSEGPLPPGGPAPVSLERDLAKTLGARVGDTVVWDVQGVAIPSVVASLRAVDWGRLATNFFAIFPPGVLEQAPRTSVLLLRVPGAEARAALQRDLVARFPNVAALDATLVLEALDAALAQVGLAVRGLSLLTLATGLVLLVAAAAASRHERTRESLLLRTLGASGATVRGVVAVEAIALGALAVGMGIATAVLASAGLVVFVFELPYRPPWGDLARLALVAFALSAALGAWQGRPAARGSPLAGLREAEVPGSGAPV